MSVWPEFVTVSRNSPERSFFDMSMTASEEAQRTADRTGDPRSVYSLLSVHDPEQKAVSHDIDALIDDREKDYRKFGGRGYAIHCGILRQLKKMGVTHLDLPGKIEV